MSAFGSYTFNIYQLLGINPNYTSINDVSKWEKSKRYYF